MRVLHSELVAEYHQQLKEKYPELTLKQTTEICSYPFIEVRRGMESHEFPTVRLKYFGTFLTYPNRIKAKALFLEKHFKECKVAPEVYFKLKGRFERYLKKKEDEGKNNTK